MHAISGVPPVRPLRGRQSLTFRTCLLGRERILRSPRDFRRVHKFGNSFAWRMSISFRAHEVARRGGGARDGRRRATAPTIPLIARTSCHGVLTRKPIYSDDNIDADAPSVRPGTADMISDNARIARGAIGAWDLTRSPPDILSSFRKGADATREGFRIAPFSSIRWRRCRAMRRAKDFESRLSPFVP